MHFSVRYIVLFSAAVCIACAVLVSSAAVALKERQDVNKALDKKQNVLEAAGLAETGVRLSPEEIAKRFENVRAQVINLATGEVVEGVDADSFDQRRRRQDPATSKTAPSNNAGVKRVPEQAQVFEVLDASGNVEMVVLPVEGYGLWSTLYGFVALDADFNTVRGLTYYDHLETPGLGGEVDNPNWKKLWPGRKIASSAGAKPQIEVIKGSAGAAADDPYRVDGLAGATITSRGVSNMLRFWLGTEGFGPFIEKRLAARGGHARRIG